MVQITQLSGLQVAEKDTFMCSTTEFVRDTDKEDGTILEVVDKATDKIVKYCQAFEGRWVDC